MNGTIRRAEARDIPQILELLTQVNALHHEGRPDLFKKGQKYTEADLEDLLQDEARPVFVWCDETDTARAHAICCFEQHLADNIRTDVKTLHLDDLCVDEGFRGRRIGKALCDHLQAFAREQGCYNLTLNVWALNEGALRFYEKLGMRPQKYCMERIL
jgi:ribosomal protein S18 acetylase RimI-like enzyme